MIFKIVVTIFVLWVSIYTFSFGVWTWNKKNKFGGLVVMFIALITTILPALYLFLK